MRAKKNIVASYLYIIINILVNLLVVRITVKHYGDEIYAFVVLAYSFITYVETFNLGTFLSNRTQIPLRSENANVYTVATVKFLAKLVIILLALWSVFYYFYSIEFIKLISSETNTDILSTGKTLINVGVLYGLVKIPLTVVLSGFAGHDRVDIEKKYNGLQQVLKITCLYIAIYLGLDVATYFALFASLGVSVLVIANFHYFSRYVSYKSKRIIKYSKQISAFYITKKSFKFYVMTITSVIVWSTDNLLVSIFFTPKILTDYSINFSIYNAGFLFITAISGALIANYGNLIRDKEYKKLNFRINLSLYTTFILAIMIFFGGILFSEDIITLWVGSGHHISDDLILAFGLFGITIGLTSVMNTILSLFASTRAITYMAFTEAILNISLSILLLRLLDVEGIAYATSISALISMVIPGVIILKNSFNNIVKIELKPLIINLLIVIGFTCFARSNDFYFVEKVVLFIVYTVFVVIYSLVYQKEYFLSFRKIINK
jgi:O-antigen/teichoic acid export membrane protein